MIDSRHELAAAPSTRNPQVKKKKVQHYGIRRTGIWRPKYRYDRRLVLALAFPFCEDLKSTTRCGEFEVSKNVHHELFSSTGLDLEDSTRIAYADL